MNKEDIFKKIGSILDDLNHQYEYLADHPRQLSALELSLFQANTDFLANHVRVLMKMIAEDSELTTPAVMSPVPLSSPVPAPHPAEEFHPAEELYPAEEPDDVEEPGRTLRNEDIFKPDREPSTFEFILNEHRNNERFEFEEKPADELFNRPLSEEEENILAQKRKLNERSVPPADPEEDEIGPEPFLVAKPAESEFPIHEEDLTMQEATPPLIDTGKSAIGDPAYQPTLNELLAAKAEKSIHSHREHAAIEDLKQGINLNDKLLYIKDLFNGYNLAYAEAIEVANKLPNFEAADNFFKKNYALKNNWAEKQATVDKFYALLNQRFKQG